MFGGTRSFLLLLRYLVRATEAFQGNVMGRRGDAATAATTLTQNSLATLFTPPPPPPAPARSGTHSSLPSVPSTLLFLFSSAARWERTRWWRWRRSVEPYFDSMGGNRDDATAQGFFFLISFFQRPVRVAEFSYHAPVANMKSCSSQNRSTEATPEILKGPT